MPKYQYVCPNGHSFDNICHSFGALPEVEAKLRCPECKSKVARDTSVASMAGGGFRKYGLWTYGGLGND